MTIKLTDEDLATISAVGSYALDAMRDAYIAGIEAGMERAAVICEDQYARMNDNGGSYAELIRAAAGGTA